MADDLLSLVGGEDGRGFGKPGLTPEEDIEHDVDVEERRDHPYFPMRCSSTQVRTWSSSGGGESPAPIPMSSSTGRPRIAGAASEASSVSRTRFASVILIDLGQVLTRSMISDTFSASVGVIMPLITQS
jgi:hypothetical protein